MNHPEFNFTRKSIMTFLNASHWKEWISSYEDIFKIIRCYTDDVKNASMVINNYLRKGEFIVFDLTKSKDDPLAIHIRFNTPLNMQKEIEARQKHKKKVPQLMSRI
ncbi:hypothetical protein RhiirC2_717588 [Rhizophagus irregularis]|uniref:Uncharacterized protein n=1 Tax=Rhizophagus irregularis TaxID=588596 RepID=A0A2N1MLS5_9GLOM|nr:hypothetical protein RhiirC2_717588 [Rhizophagus irregularis]